MKNQPLLLVDDDRHCSARCPTAARARLQDRYGGQSAEGIAAVDRKTYDLALVDIRLATTTLRPDWPTSAHNRPGTSSSCTRLRLRGGPLHGDPMARLSAAVDFLTKPLIDEELDLAIGRALSQRQVIEENKTLKAQLDLRFGMENIIGHDHRMLKIYDMIDSVADTRATVLITGESGTGKSMIARAIPPPQRPPRQVVRGSGLRGAAGNAFGKGVVGHVAGAFTGRRANSSASSSRPMRHDLPSTRSPRPARHAVKLLRVIADLEFEQVGGTKTFKIDTRVILATNEDLGRAVAEGRFRRTCSTASTSINIELPSLRERISDILCWLSISSARSARSPARRSAASATTPWPPCNVSVGPAMSANCRT